MLNRYLMYRFLPLASGLYDEQHMFTAQFSTQCVEFLMGLSEGKAIERIKENITQIRIDSAIIQLKDRWFDKRFHHFFIIFRSRY